tara:strand:+ start:463 stop:1026 length:564 start_codon:yes stop_codon:yes gene_type:complete
MSIKIRLARAGSKKRPFYRVVAADSRMPRDGRFIEKVGTYNPLLQKDNAQRVILDLERIKHWLDRGAQVSDRVARMLEASGTIPAKTRNNPQKAIPGKAAQERLKTKSETADEGADTTKNDEPVEEKNATASETEVQSEDTNKMTEVSQEESSTATEALALSVDTKIGNQETVATDKKNDSKSVEPE